MPVNTIDHDAFVSDIQSMLGITKKTPAKVLARFYVLYRDAWEKDFNLDPETEYYNRAPHDAEGWTSLPARPERTSRDQYEAALDQLVRLGILERRIETWIDEQYDFNASRRTDGTHPTKKVERQRPQYRIAPERRERVSDWILDYDRILRREEAQVADYIDALNTAKESLRAIASAGEFTAVLASPQESVEYADQVRVACHNIESLAGRIRQAVRDLPYNRARVEHVKALLAKAQKQATGEYIDSEATEVAGEVA